MAFGGVKAGLMADPGEGCAGRVILVPIGHRGSPPCRPASFSAADLAGVLPDRDAGPRSTPGSPGHRGRFRALHRAAALVDPPPRPAREWSRQTLVRKSWRGRSWHEPEAIWEPARARQGPGRGSSAWPGRGQQLAAGPRRIGCGRKRRPPAVVDAGALELLPVRCPPNWTLTPRPGNSLPFWPGRSARHAEGRRVADGALRRLAAGHTGAVFSSKVPQRSLLSPSGAISASQWTPVEVNAAGSGRRPWRHRRRARGGIRGIRTGRRRTFRRLGDRPRRALAAVAAVGASIHGMAGSTASAGGHWRLRYRPGGPRRLPISQGTSRRMTTEVP